MVTAPHLAVLEAARRAVASRRGEATALVILIFVAALLRVALAFGKGFPPDIDELVRWARGMAIFGPADFYTSVGPVIGPFPPNYPALVYLLWPLGALFGGGALPVAVKLVSAPFDLLIGVTLYALVRRHAGGARGLAAAAFYLFNPAVLIAGPYWGQVDGFGTALALLALLALAGRRYAVAGALGAVAILAKPQYVIAGIVVAAVCLAIAVRQRRVRPTLAAAAGALGGAAAVLIPLRLTPEAYLRIQLASAEIFQLTSLYAFNIWGLFVGFFKPDAPYAGIGAALLASAVVGALVPLLRGRRDTAAILAVAALLSFAFFFLPTRIHERYLFPAMALVAPFAATRARLRWPAIALAAGFTVDLLYALWAHRRVTGFTVAPIVEETVFSTTGVAVVTLVMLGSAALFTLRVLTTDLTLDPQAPATGLRWPRVPIAERAWSSRLARRARAYTPSRRSLLAAILAVPFAVTAVGLLPELTPAPLPNDGINHVLFVQRANEALGNGENPFDHWVAEMELGFPEFLYYQHLPHLAVVALHRVLLGLPDERTLFDLVRYVLLVAFPLTVFWSMRQMRFGVVAATVGSAAATLIATAPGFGLEYGSYIWRGYGLYTQLWASHLAFIVLACMTRLLHDGRGVAAAIASFAVLALSHLAYAYMAVLTSGIVLLAGLRPGNARGRFARLALVGAATAVISSYMTIPFVLGQQYLLVSPYLPRSRFDGFGAPQVLGWLVRGELLDYGRLPVLTVLLGLGIVSAILTRTRLALLSLGLFFFWLVMYMGRLALGPLSDLLPFQHGLPVHRFLGALHVAAVLLIGIGGEAIWGRLRADAAPRRALAAAALLVLLLLPAAAERQSYYETNGAWIAQSAAAVAADADARAILEEIAALPPGRVYAGLHTTWGDSMNFGLRFKGLHFYDLLTPQRLMPVGPPYYSWSLNSDLQWEFNEAEPAHYELFNVRYVVAPRDLSPQPFWQKRRETGRYSLYEVSTSGYAQLVEIATRRAVPSQRELFDLNRAWFTGRDVAAGRFTRYDYPAGPQGGRDAATPACVSGGRTIDRVFREDRIEVEAACDRPSTLVLKTTYHPNWRVTVDGAPAAAFMVTPSFIGVALPAGSHVVEARYLSDPLKAPLLAVGALTFAGSVLFGRRLEHLLARAAGGSS